MSSYTKFDQIADMISTLEKDGKQVQTLMMLKNEETPNPYAPSFNSKDISAFGVWKNEKVVQFCVSKFDFLVYLENDLPPEMENILLHSTSKCRIGLFQSNGNHIFEMMIKSDDPSNFSAQLQEVYRYLKILK